MRQRHCRDIHLSLKRILSQNLERPSRDEKCRDRVTVLYTRCANFAPWRDITITDPLLHICCPFHFHFLLFN